MELDIKREEKLFLALSTSFIALLLVSNIIASKIVILGGLMVPAAVICYALTFLVSDTIAEVWGKERTKYVIKLGFFASLLAALFIKLAIHLPAAPFWANQKEYELILGTNLRIVVASMTAYLVSQLHDVWAFHFWKEKTKGKHLWLRNNLSTGTSQFIDTGIFITIAFYGTGIPLIPLILGQYAVKLVISICDTPFVYFLVSYVRKTTDSTLQSRSSTAKGY